MNQRFTQQPALVRIVLQPGVPVLGWILTMALMEMGRYTLGITSRAGLITLVSVSALLALSGLVLLLLTITPAEQETYKFRLRAARRMLITRVNLLTVNNLLVYAGIALGITGAPATILTGALFFLNLLASGFLSVQVDTPALDPEQADRKKKATLAEAAAAAKKDAVQPTRPERSVTVTTKVSEDSSGVATARFRADAAAT